MKLCLKRLECCSTVSWTQRFLRSRRKNSCTARQINGSIIYNRELGGNAEYSLIGKLLNKEQRIHSKTTDKG